MSAAALSIVVYGAYLLANGFGLLLFPDLSLSIIGLPASADVWIRVVGLLAAEIGFYYVFIGAKGIAQIYRATIFGRAVAAATFCALVFLGMGPPQLLLFAAIDTLSAAWTYFALKQRST